MPELSRFYGMVIQMFFKDIQQHHLPHIHVVCGGAKAVLALDGTLLEGKLPPKQLRALLVWMDFREDELKAAWEKAVRKEHFGKIKPLE